MGFRFNRRVSILPGVRVNFGKTGASLSVGRRGSWLTFGKRGTYATVGLPGTGLSYTTKLNASRPAVKPSPRPQIPAWVWVSGILFFAWVMGNLRHHPSELPVTNLSPSSDATVSSTVPHAAISSTTPIVKAKKRHGAAQKIAPSSPIDDVSAPLPTADAPPVNTTNADQSTQVNQEAPQRKPALADEQRVQADPSAASTAPLQQTASPQVFARCLAYLRSTGVTESSPGEFSRVCANERQ
jgi:hypothetical protein